MLNDTLDRVITIEDVAELAFESPNFVSLVERQANIEGRGEFGVERLFREALRMRPDRIVLGEVRGAEFGLMLQALNTGHAGSAATLHANSLDSVPQRLIGLGLLAGLSPETTKVLAKTAIDVVIHLDGGKPKIARLGELLD
jgi:pilus assembly protein CpaF